MVSVATLNVIVLVTGLLGVVVAGWGIVSALIELISLNAYSMNGARRVTTITAMIREALCLIAQLVIFVVGLMLVLDSGEGVTVGWPAVALCISVGCLMDQYRRHIHRDIAERERLTAVEHGSRRSTDPKIDGVK